MVIRKKRSRAQTSLEYIVLFVAIAAALVATSIYIQRSFQGRYRELGDQVGNQYEPGVTVISNEITTTSTTNEYMIDDSSGNQVPATTSESSTTQDIREETPAYK